MRLIRYGGDRIKQKLFLSVLLLFGIALLLNVNSVSAANATGIHTSPKVVAVDPANNAIIQKSQNIKVKFNESIKSGNNYVELKHGNVLISTKKSVNGNTLTITPSTTLSTNYKYTLILHSGSVTSITGDKIGAYTTSFTVSQLTLAQMKDGLKRAQSFYNTNYRLPNYVSYGDTKISITTFQKIIATQGLKINTTTTVKSSNSDIDSSVATIMKGASKYSYSHSASTAEAMERNGAGDCWAMSDYLYKKMRAAGIHARIIEYPTAYASNHRSVQYKENGQWVNAPYRTYFSTNMFNNTQSYGRIKAQC
ncbi:MAG: Ig-like domain-containing protein [Methanobacterium sp. ERen5]|nr:MAG: Ig-like domain-containing protein [Methanobacterium sp. ERen5]